MSRNGSNLADWQDIYNGVNERRKAAMFNSFDGTSSGLVPVVQSKNHITHTDTGGLGVGLIDKIPVRSFCDPFTPLTFYTWDDQYDVGSQPNGVNDLEIMRYVHEYGSYPNAGYYLAGSGWFLDWIDGALGYMTKAATHFQESHMILTTYRASYQIDPQTGYVYDLIPGYSDPPVTIYTYADLWAYAVQHLHEETGTFSTLDASVSTGGSIVEIRFSSWKVPHPGVIPADLTLYYSATGDDMGITPTDYPFAHPHVRGYATATKQNASASSPLTLGFTSSVIPSTTPAPGYSVYETLYNFYAVWDFAPYMQY